MKRGRKRILNDQQVKELREAYADREDKRSISQLARYFKVSPVTADNVIMKRGAYAVPPMTYDSIQSALCALKREGNR